jgi:nucleoside-diphosphate-sugar epimerase
MKALVTGGLGFIGSHLVERLVAEGHQVVVLDDYSNGKEDNLTGCLNSTRLDIIKGDIRKVDQIRLALPGVDRVFHLAAMVSVQRSLEDPESARDINERGTLNLLQESARAKVKRLVFASTTAVYGTNVIPLKEDSVTEPLSPYAVSKVSGERHCREFSESHEIETVILRLFNVYGQRASSGPYAGVMVNFAKALMEGLPLVIFGDGEQTRDFVHVRDVADAMLLASARQQIDGEVFNIGTGVGTSINQLATIFLRSSGDSRMRMVYKQPREGEVRHSVADIEKANRILAYRPRVHLEAGIREYMEWFRTL